MEFQDLTLSHAPLLKAYFSRETSRICDRTLGGALMWRNCFHTKVFEDGECLYLKSETAPGKWAYTTPLGNPALGLERLRLYGEQTGEEISFCSVPEGEKDMICSRFPGYRGVETRDWFDYLYRRENLATFSGKKLAGQRNHRNFFLKNFPSWNFEEITRENLPQAKTFYAEYSEKNQKDSDFFREEEKAVLEVLNHPEVYGFFGGMLFASEKPVAISFGEIVGDTLFVHIEKAHREVRGAYPMMVSGFISRFSTEDVVYVNREEDVGDEGLRYSKESYHPERMLKKYSVEKIVSGK